MSDEAPEPNKVVVFPGFGFDFDQFVREFIAVKQSQPFSESGARWLFINQFPVVAENHVQPRIGNRDPDKLFADVTKLGGRSLEELPPHRGVIEQLLHFDDCSHRTTARFGGT